MSFQVTARKWRPMVFGDVVGQAHVTNTLQNAIAANRVAHAYIFSGTRGCGKTTTARILARTLNCTSPINQNPDNTCDTCKEIIEGRGMDVIEIDGASNRGVEEIRNLRDSVRYTPTHGKYKIYIIDEVHMLTKEAFNALLKTLEEPPPQVVFIFATTEVHKVPMTILSRCQRFDFKRIAINEIIKTLSTIAGAEGVTIEDDALMVIAKRADGSLRDAQSIFDQVRSFCGNDIKTEELLKTFNVVDQRIYFRVSESLRTHDSQAALQLVDEVLKSGYDLHEFIVGLSEHFRNLLVACSTRSTRLLDVSEHDKQCYVAEAPRVSENDLLRYIKQTYELDQALRWAAQPRYLLEVGLLQMVSMDSSVQISDLLRQIGELKKKLINTDSKKSPTESRESAHRESLPTTEVKVIGEVGAGYLKSKAAPIYSTLAGMDLAQFAGVPHINEPSLIIPYAREQSTVARTVSQDEIQERWPDFVNGVAKMRIAVGMTLREAQILDIQNGLVRIGCSEEYDFSTLKRNKEFLSDAFHQIIGTRIAIEPVLNSSQNTVIRNKQHVPVSNGENERVPPATSPVTNEHPILVLLKRELDAEKIE